MTTVTFPPGPIPATGCGFCLLGASFRIIPFVACAMIAHGLGNWRHWSRLEE
jgi:hypothetical protein